MAVFPTLEEFAVAKAGNHFKFDSFVWFRQSDVADPENWAVLYTQNRDSKLLAQSNAAYIANAMKPFSSEADEPSEDPDVVFETHTHPIVGHVDGFSLRVYRDGQITDAFKTYYELQDSLDGYGVLDECDYSRRETEATYANIEDSAWSLKEQYDLPENWVSEVYDWLDENLDSAISNSDDEGGYPEEDELKQAFEGLGYKLKTIEVADQPQESN